MDLTILSPNGSVFKGEANYVLLPGIGGYLGILNNHAPLISALKKGKIKVQTKANDPNSEQFFEIKGGTVEVLNNTVTILID